MRAGEGEGVSPAGAGGSPPTAGIPCYNAAEGGRTMARTDWRSRISVDPELHHGEPCIAGTRVPVAVIVGSLADGMPECEVLRAYPQLQPADIRAALAYAAEVLRQDPLLPLAV